MNHLDRRSLCLLGVGALATVAHAEDKGGKSPPPPESTLALQEHVSRATLGLSVVYTHQPDRDFASLLAAHRKSVLELAQLELKFGTDRDMKALAQRIVDAAPAEDASLQAWRKAHAG